MPSKRPRKNSHRLAVEGERQRLIVLFLLLAGVVMLAGGVMLSSPRHHAFYRSFLRLNTSPPSAVESLHPQASVLLPPDAPLTGGGNAPAPSSSAAVPDRVMLKVMERAPLKLPFQGVPPRWAIKTFAGRPHVETVEEERRLVMRLMSQQSSFALYRDLAVNLKEFPVLSWSWKVTKLPQGGDVRRAATDDQAAQVYVIFPRWPFPQTSSDVLGYVWDSRAPAGLRLQSPRAGNVRLIVLQSGQEKLGRWLKESRNVAEDYRALFGKEPPLIGRVAVMVDSNDTHSEAEAWFHDLVFLSPARGHSRSSRLTAPALRQS